jgi:hypothetical protein
VARGDLLESSDAARYIWAFFKITCQMFTAGYGRHEANFWGEAVCAILIMFVGPTVLMGFVEGMINKILIERGNAERAFRFQCDTMDGYMRDKGLPLDLRKRVRSNLDYRWTTKKVRGETEREFLLMLN